MLPAYFIKKYKKGNGGGALEGSPGEDPSWKHKWELSAQGCFLLHKGGLCLILGCAATQLCHLLSRRGAWFSDVHFWHLVYQHTNGHLASVTILCIMSHRHRASTLRHGWVSERLFLWQQRTYFLIQTVRFRKGYLAAVSQWKEKIVSDKRGKKKTSRIHFVFSAPRTSHSEGNCYLSIPDVVQGSELMACLPFAWMSLKMWGAKRVARERLFQILISKRSRGCGAKSAGPSPGPTHFSHSLPHPPSCSLQDKMKLWHPRGPQSQHFHTVEVKWLLSQRPYDTIRYGDTHSCNSLAWWTKKHQILRGSTPGFKSHLEQVT